MEELVMNTMNKMFDVVFSLASKPELQNWGNNMVQEIAHKFGMPPM